MISDLIRAVIDKEVKKEWKNKTYQKCWRYEKNLKNNEKKRKMTKTKSALCYLMTRIDVDHDNV